MEQVVISALVVLIGVVCGGTLGFVLGYWKGRAERIERVVIPPYQARRIFADDTQFTKKTWLNPSSNAVFSKQDKDADESHPH